MPYTVWANDGSRKNGLLCRLDLHLAGLLNLSVRSCHDDWTDFFTKTAVAWFLEETRWFLEETRWFLEETN